MVPSSICTLICILLLPNKRKPKIEWYNLLRLIALLDRSLELQRLHIELVTYFVLPTLLCVLFRSSYSDKVWSLGNAQRQFHDVELL